MSPEGELAHEVWARHYDTVLEETFGPPYRVFTARTLAVVERLVAPPASIVDFGAGTGRLTVPLAERGYEVTAVDPSPAMLRELAHRAEQAGVDVACVRGRLESRPDGGIHDLALCVFSVLGYVLTESALEAAARCLADSVLPGGTLLVEIPDEDSFRGFEVDTERMRRRVSVGPEPGRPHVCRYREDTTLRTCEGWVRIRDRFTLRYWPSSRVGAALEGSGWRWVREWTDEVPGWGGRYLSFERAD